MRALWLYSKHTKESDSRYKQVEGEFDYAERHNVPNWKLWQQLFVPLSKPLVLWGVRLVHTLKGLQNQAHGFFPFPDPHANTSWSSSTSQSSLVALDHVPGKYRRKNLIMPMLFSSGNLCISFILLHQTYQQWKFRTKFFLFFGGRKKCCVGCLWYVKPEYRVASSAWHSLKN